MYCRECGTQITDNAVFCMKCGVATAVQVVSAREADSSHDATMRWLLPVGRSGYAIVAGYLGLFSLLVIPAPLALLFGVIAIGDIKRNPAKHGMGRAIFGIVMGILGTGVLTVLGWRSFNVP